MTRYPKDAVRSSTERGIAMITTMLVLMLMSALLVGFTTVVMSDQRYRFIDRDRGQAFYAASGGIEKLTADLGNLFFTNVAPSGDQLTALTSTASMPAIPGVTFAAVSTPEPLPASSLSTYNCTAPNTIATVGANGYTIKYCASPAGNPTNTAGASPIKTGPFEGLIALQTPYQLDVTARSSTGGEAHLVRTIESVAIPVFQFGMFSDVDLSFSAAGDFGFGGRVHTNGNLYLTQGQSSTLTMSDKVTAVKEVVRERMSNGVPIDTVNQTGTVRIATGSGWRDLLRTEGSVVDGPASAQNEPLWHTVSLSGYNSYIRNSRTGAKPLNLPLVAVGGSNPDLVKRPKVGEDTTNPILYGERLYSKASLRILLSDNAADLTTLPQVTAAGAVQLDGNWNTTPPAGYGAISVAAAPAVPVRLPVALSSGVIMATAGDPASGGAGVINVTAATAAAFKPTFTFTVPAGVFSCSAKRTSAPWQLTGCVGVPTTLGATLNAISPATGSAIGASGTTTNSDNLLQTITFASQELLDRFKPMPFWDAAGALITCTGWDLTTYAGCSSVPANNASLMSAAMSDAGIGLLGGFIKIDRQDADGTWHDVTTEILSYGIGAPNLSGQGCPDPTPNAILRLQRLRDNGGGTPTTTGGGCNYNTDALGAKDPANWWPNVLFDARESVLRDSNYPGPANLTLGGVMHYVALDAGNLAKWFNATVAPFNASTGASAIKDNGGYTVYFSDRRNNRNAASLETGEYGWEDFVNPGIANGTPNGVLDPGEDVNANTQLDVYGGRPNYSGTYDRVPPCAACAAVYGGLPVLSATPYALTTTALPTTTVSRRVAQVNRPILFRRALKLVNGAVLAPAIAGLTVVSENPVYIQGDWNATATFAVTDPHAATAVIADSVTVLSNLWNDNNSLASPYTTINRARAAQSYYRVAIIGGKGPIFTRPGDVAAASSFGTDGGAHSFLRMLEGGAGTTVHYRGSMATFFYNRQAVGSFKCCGGVVYGVPIRDYIFDVDFLDPAGLPPNTPVFRDMNAVGFSQELRPGR